PLAPNPVAALMINGMLDRSIRPDGGLSEGRGAGAWDGTPAQPHIAQGTYWARVNGCHSTPSRTQTGTLISWKYDCPSGRAVTLLQLTDLGHAWPGGERGSRLG